MDELRCGRRRVSASKGHDRLRAADPGKQLDHGGNHLLSVSFVGATRGSKMHWFEHRIESSGRCVNGLNGRADSRMTSTGVSQGKMIRP